MDENATTEKTRKTPGPAFFLAALFLYLLVVHGTSILTAGPQPRVPEVAASEHLPAFAAALMNKFLHWTGRAPLALEGMALLLLYGSMIALFYLTRRLVNGPIWLGSLAAALFMVHPAKTEVLFSPQGLFQLCGALLALLSLLSYLRLLDKPDSGRHAVAFVCFTAASVPFSINAMLFAVLIMLEFYLGKPESTSWIRQLPFLAMALMANGLHRDALFSSAPDPGGTVGPLLLLIYPIGLLPSTVAALSWMWGLLAMALLILSLVFVRNGAYRVCVLALLAYRFYPGTAAIDLSSMSGGGQLLVPIALGCIAFAGLCRWLMQFDAWGRPVVVITTMICMVLFVLQFQANRAQLKKPHLPSGAAIVARMPEGARRA